MFSIISVCLSDYFQGTTRPCLAIPVQNNTTAEEFVDGIEYEYNNTDFPSLGDDERGCVLERKLQEMVKQLPEQPFDDLDPSTNDGEGEPVYAYVVYYD